MSGQIDIVSMLKEKQELLREESSVDKDVQIDEAQNLNESGVDAESTEETQEQPQKRKRDVLSRLNQKHKQLMQEKERADKLQSELEALQRTPSLKSTTDLADTRVQDTDDDEEISDWDAMVAEVKRLRKQLKEGNSVDIDAKVSEKLTEREQQAQQAKHIEYLRGLENEFGTIMQKSYEDQFDEDLGGYDDDTMTEMRLVITRFAADPEHWLGVAKDFGFDEMKMQMMRKKNEQKPVNKLRSMLKSEEDMSVSRGNSGYSDSEKAQVTSIKDLVKWGTDKIKRK